MKASAASKPLVAIACGGTGGHLFPGLAIGEQLALHGCEVQLLISAKEIDQQAVRSVIGVDVVTLPAIGMTRGNLSAFFQGLWRAYRQSAKHFRQRAPQAVLAMGGFTSAPPILAGRAGGAATFLHESNVIPGKANRWLAHVVDQIFVGFPGAAGRLHHANVLCTGTPVRSQFQPADRMACRTALGLAPADPVVLVMGGSQGAIDVNTLVLSALRHFHPVVPAAQFLHLTGPADIEKARQGYAAEKVRAVVRPFLTEMELALGAATVAVSRAGGSSLAELAAMRVPSVLIPYPTAADDHQRHNAKVFSESGAALVLEPKGASAEALASLLAGLIADASAHAAMERALERWHRPHAAEVIVERMMAFMGARHGGRHHPSESAENRAGGSHAFLQHGPSGFKPGQLVTRDA